MSFFLPTVLFFVAAVSLTDAIFITETIEIENCVLCGDFQLYGRESQLYKRVCPSLCLLVGPSRNFFSWQKTQK